MPSHQYLLLHQLILANHSYHLFRYFHLHRCFLQHPLHRVNLNLQDLLHRVHLMGQLNLGLHRFQLSKFLLRRLHR